jgi:cytosine deaminase
VNGRTVDLAVIDGVIESVTDHDPIDQSGTDLQDWLLLPPLTEPHSHLDKALTAEEVRNPTGDLDGAVQAWAAAAAEGRFTPDNVIERSTRALELLLANGVTAVRTHINISPDVGASNVYALHRVRESFAGLIDIQIVALPRGPMTGPDSSANRAAFAEALDAGVDVVGGCPHLEDGATDAVAFAFDRALEFGLPVDLHTDETLDPSVLTVLDMVERVHELGFDKMVSASHCVSLGVQPLEAQHDIAARIAAAGIAVLPQPQTNLYLQGRDHQAATPRGLTAIRPLVEAGVVVAAGADNVQDPYNLVGRSDPLETAALLVMAGHVTPEDAYTMVSNNGRKVMGLAPVEFRPGDPADFVAINAPSIRAAIADAPKSRRVYRAGRLVASSDQQTTINWRAST